MMKSSIKVTCMTTEDLHPPQQMFNELTGQKQQLPNTMFFHKVEKKKCPLSKALSHQHHLRLTSTSHHRFRLLSLHLSKMMILMTLLPIRQKLNSQAQRHNTYTITPHQWSSQQQEEWRSCFDGKTWFLLLLQRFDGEARFLLLSSLETVQYRYSILSLFYRPLRIRLKRQNPLLSYVQDSEKVHH